MVSLMCVKERVSKNVFMCQQGVSVNVFPTLCVWLCFKLSLCVKQGVSINLAHGTLVHALALLWMRQNRVDVGTVYVTTAASLRGSMLTST